MQCFRAYFFVSELYAPSRITNHVSTPAHAGTVAERTPENPIPVHDSCVRCPRSLLRDLADGLGGARCAIARGEFRSIRGRTAASSLLSSAGKLPESAADSARCWLPTWRSCLR